MGRTRSMRRRSHGRRGQSTRSDPPYGGRAPPDPRCVLEPHPMTVPSLSAAVGRRIQELRISAGVPLRRLAKESGLSVSALQYIEEGRAQPSVGTLADLAAQLGTSVAELVREAKQVKATPALTPEQLGKAIVELPGGVDKLELVEAAAVRYALALCGGNKSRAAKLLGIERQAVMRRTQKFRVR